jgi:hypothetical protein|tara:strand:- start:313 stop:489 length:177 start_codon:yes stop_codon:yes gene_type:complete
MNKKTVSTIIAEELKKNKINKNIEILTSPDREILYYCQNRDLMINKLSLDKESLKRLL